MVLIDHWADLIVPLFEGFIGLVNKYVTFTFEPFMCYLKEEEKEQTL